jgi:hypothetical protein
MQIRSTRIMIRLIIKKYIIIIRITEIKMGYIMQT